MTADGLRREANDAAGATHRGRVFSLDAVRGAASLLVCLQHLRTASFVDFPSVTSHGVFERALYFVTNLGHEAVMVFFVLSGFFVGGSVLRAGERFRWSDYLLARGLRLWCVLIPCLVLTFLCDRWLVANAPGVLSGAYQPIWHSAPRAGAYDASWLTALGNVFFVQTVWVPVYGSNGPLWSLANEAWYYLLFPLLCLAVRSRPLWQRVVLGLLAAELVIAMPVEMRWLFAVWMLGVGVYVLDRRAIRLPRGSLPLSAVLFAAALVLSRLRLMPPALDPLPDYLVGITFAVFCLVLARRDGGLRVPHWLRRGASWLSDISYSLYLSHFPFVLVIAAACYGRQRMQPDLGGSLVFVGWLVLLLVIGHAVWWCFESRTPALRAWADKWRSARPEHADHASSRR